MEKIYRTRIAPSPTGDPHVGTLRNALYNYIIAKQSGGQLILRIEDTDKNREVEGSIDRIYEALEWIGTTPYESPKHQGKFGPYLQSERLDLYQKYADQLVKDGHAYYCFCTSERLEQLRADQAAKHLPPKYDGHCRHLGSDEVEKRKSLEKFVIRMMVPENEVISWDDAVKGKVEFNSKEIDDQVLLKSDGFPTYHLACVVDDHEMQINLVMRSDEWLSSTPKHLLLYRYFNWNLPIFAHLPLILNSDRSKVSKRKNNTSALYYKNEQGYHPLAMAHFLMFMGWAPKDVEEHYTLERYLDVFSIDRIGASPAIYDMAKLNSLSHQYFVVEDINKLIDQYLVWLNDERHTKTEDEQKFIELCQSEIKVAIAMLEVVRTRGNTFAEMSEAIKAFFKPEVLVKLDDINMDGKITNENVKAALEIIKNAITQIEVTNLPQDSNARIEWLTNYFREKQPKDLGGRDYLHPTRVAITGDRVSMNMFEFLSVSLLKNGGKEEIIARLNKAKSILD